MGALPPFHLLGEYVFQDLCRDLLDSDPAVAYCAVYGNRGQSQDGIDLLAPRPQNDGCDVGQCKCYAQFAPADIANASEEFLSYLPRWQEHGVRRFILFVASDLQERKRQDEILRQRQRFAELGIEYEVWAAPRIHNLLRGRPDLVSSYFNPRDFWIREICGLHVTTPAHVSVTDQTVDFVRAAQTLLLEQLSVRLSSDVARQVEALRESWRQGRVDDALEGVATLKSDRATWDVLQPEAKAQVLRFEAGLSLEHGDGLSRAHSLAEEARRLAPGEDDRRIEALIARHEHGPETALGVLGEPQTLDQRHLFAGLLIEKGRVEEAAQVVDFSTHGFTPTAETFRLQALCYAGSADMERARLAVQRASEMAPAWESVRTVGAVVGYLGSLSKSVQPHGVPAWPHPVGWAFVLRDDESIGRLRVAADRFAELVGERPLKQDTRRAYETWYLACLANDPERQEDAARVCAKLIDEDPAHLGALAWGAARGYEIDAARVESALSHLVGTVSGPDQLQLTLSLATCLMTWDRARDAVDLLERMRSRFDSEPARGAWLFARIEAGAASGGDVDGIAIPDDLDEVYRAELTLFALRTRAERGSDWLPYAEAAHSAYLRTGHASNLLEAFAAWTRAHQWQTAAAHAETLVGAVESTESVRLTAFAAHNADRFELCIRLLDDHRERFPHAKLPPELRALRARALRGRGDLRDAVAEAEEVAREQPSTENELALAQMLLEKGDLPRLVALAWRIAERNDLDADSALRIARVIAVDDPALSRRLWHVAVESGIADESVAVALDLAYRLGLDDQTRGLAERMDHIAQAGLHGNRVFKVSELPGLQADLQERRQQIVDAYRSGSIAVHHLLAADPGFRLVGLYRQNLARNEISPDPAFQFGLLAYHGMRAVPASRLKNAPRWRLQADITALLLATHLGILDAVEQTFGTIAIPEGVTRELASMRASLAHNQPKRLEQAREVVGLVDAGKIAMRTFSALPEKALIDLLGRERAGMLAQAEEEGGHVLDYLPIRRALSGPPAELSKEVQKYFVNARAIVDGLRRYGPLTRPEHRRALRSLGTLGHEAPGNSIPATGAFVCCYGNTAEALASAGVLRIAAERFRLVVDAEGVSRLRIEIDAWLQQQAEVAWISELMQRVSRGIDSGRYRMISSPPWLDDNDAGPIHGLKTLLAHDPAPADALWVDDRWSTGHWRRGDGPILGTVDVLRGLEAHGAVSRSERYELLTRLRAANVRYVPLSGREIVHHLVDAPVENGVVVETRALIILRRYTAAWLMDGSFLERPFLNTGQPNQKTEVTLLEGHTRAVTAAIKHVLTEGHADHPTRQARAEWIMQSLYADYAAMRELAGVASPDDDTRQLVVVSALRLVTHGLTIGWSQGAKGRERRRRYFKWVWRRVLRPRSNVDRLFLPLMADMLKEYLRPRSDIPEEYKLPMLNLLHRQLPPRLREALNEIPEFRASLGIEAVDTIAAAGVHFERQRFIRAAAEAINGRSSSVPILGEDREVEFRPAQTSASSRGFELSGIGEEVVHLADDLLGILDDSAAAREALLRGHPEWFDGGGPETDQWIVSVASTEDPVRRFLEVESTRKDSPERAYGQLVRKLRYASSVRYGDLQPRPALRLLQHFRLQADWGSGRGFRRGLNDGANTLIAELGLSKALERWAGLPVPLPQRFASAVECLGSDEQLALIRKLLRTAGSPISDLHLVRLLWTLRKANPAFGRLAQRRARRMLSSKSGVKFQTFHTILMWAADGIARIAGGSKWPAYIRLAMVWLHAHRIYAALQAAGGDMERVGKEFASVRDPLSARVFHEDAAYALDAAQPSRVARLPFLLNGLAYAFADAAPGEIREDLRRTVSSVMFVDLEDARVPHVSLLRDFSLARNGLGSFLANRRQSPLRNLLVEADAGLLASNGLRQFERVLADLLRTEPESNVAWFQTFSVLGDLHPPRELADTLQQIVPTTDFPAFVSREPIIGGLALRLAASTAAYSGSAELRAYVRQALISTAEQEARRYSRLDEEVLEGNSNASSHIVQAAADLVKDRTTPTATLMELTALLEDLVGAWPTLARPIGSFALHAWEEFPAADGQHFARLAVRCRSIF